MIEQEGRTPDRSEARRELFQKLLAEHGDQIYAFAYSLCGSEAEASDLTAEAFAKALRNFDRYDDSRPFYSWVYKIVQNVHYDNSRRLERRATVSLDENSEAEDAAERLPDGQPPLDARMETDEALRRLDGALARLPARFREPLVLCDMTRMSYEEIGRALRLPVGTVRSRIFRGRRELRRLMEPYLRAGGDA